MRKIELIRADLRDYPFIQNMARYYVYDLSRFCGRNSHDWSLPNDGLYESFDFKNYFLDSDRRAYLIKVDNETAGFILLNKVCISHDSDWNVGEFFVLARFQGKGVGKEAFFKIVRKFPGQWEVSVIPENKPALDFWRKTIADISKKNFNEEVKQVSFDQVQPNRIVFTFLFS